MATILMLPGAGGAGWYWSRVVPLLKEAGHDTIAVDFPGSDEKAGLDAYADIVLRAVDGRNDVIVVAQSMGGFTAAMVAEKLSALRGLVFLNAMIPAPRETAGQWGDNVGSSKARTAAAKAGGYSPEFTLETYFLHDLPADVAKDLMKHDGEEAKTAFHTPCGFEGWPKVPIHVLVGEDDRLFPAELQERVARDRIGAALTSLERVPGGHLAALAHPEPIAKRIIALVE